jgi:two-component system sensor histidine kinase/response regulator
MKYTVNPEKIQELFELDDEGDVLKELINLFLPSTESKLVRLNEVRSAANPADIKPIAHEMRSSSANLGAEILSDLATQLEYLAVDSSYKENASVVIQKMHDEYQQVKKKLLEHL